jgi:hypothetical protein
VARVSVETVLSEGLMDLWALGSHIPLNQQDLNLKMQFEVILEFETISDHKTNYKLIFKFNLRFADDGDHRKNKLAFF